MRISYTVVDSPLGRLLVAGTARGLCFVSLGDTDGSLEKELSNDYPAADIFRDDETLAGWTGAILNYLEGDEAALDLPVDVRGTAFQQRVWEYLRSIPYGSTRTYGEIARMLGYSRTAARAVGRACATNPVSLVIPCHRALREGGALGGYRWGLDRKALLLAQEQRATQLSLGL
jgi:AraC family transcriptional regulator, regulatory protein of adaptative response / methylated-DNA-[protein]-cysteine methyltransferase